MTFKQGLDRVSQFAMAKGQYIMRYGVPDLLEGENSVLMLPEIMKAEHADKPLIVAGKTVSKNGIMDGFLQAADKVGVEYVIFDGAEPNPTIENVEAAVKMYHENGCNGIVAFGGGSSMDCAKIAGARIARPHKGVEQLRGIMKVGRKLPPLYAIPTTSGTGSEATIAAVVVNKETQHKYAVMDPKLLPFMAVLDPVLTETMPKSVTAATGMDALTHAVESYINKYGSKFADAKSRQATVLIFDNLEKAYNDGSNLDARGRMQKAAWFAGIAFTRNAVGYVHALGHPLSGLYNLPHGLVMASILPKVLREYGDSVTEKLSELGTLVGIQGDSKEEISGNFIAAIEGMNERMNIPKDIEQIKDEDIEKMAGFALEEANGTYPTPQMWDKQKLEEMYLKIAGRK